MKTEIAHQLIENRIFTFGKNQVMIDRDLAEMYGVETKVLNQAVKRNLNRFPSTFRYALSNTEKMELVTNCDRFESLKHSSINPYAFTGVAFASSHDRFMILDHTEVYHIGASLKDLGKKWFAFSKLEADSVTVLQSIKELI